MNTTTDATAVEAADRLTALNPQESQAQVTEDAIRLRAYNLWQAAGEPQDWDDHFWLRAESELHTEVPERT
jgi:hypothetical protein